MPLLRRMGFIIEGFALILESLWRDEIASHIDLCVGKIGGPICGEIS